MAVTVIVGAQWGDEGKGKVVDRYTEGADVVARFGGGANAGHTLVVNGQKLVTHLLPSGVLHRGKVNVLGAGMVIDPAALLEEIADCQQRGLLGDDAELQIADRAHVILSYHRQIDALREAGAGAIGTTKRGIGPAYEAKAARRGVRVADLLRPERLRPLVEHNVAELDPYVIERGGKPLDARALCDEALALGERLRRWVSDTSRYLHEAVRAGKHVLAEGAQGAMLDLDHGTYPFVTSSSTIAGGACSGLGLGPTTISKVVGITKAYATRVGGGPFPTELTDGLGDTLRVTGAEFGSTTGRPRRCGWLDLPALRMAARLSGMTGLAVTKLDVLSAMPRVDLCVGYRLNGRVLDEVPVDPGDLAEVVPVLESFGAMPEDSRQARSLDDLAPAVRKYLARIETEVGVPLCLVSVGPGREATIDC
jgi:adenylosuccinate synthase